MSTQSSGIGPGADLPDPPTATARPFVVLRFGGAAGPSVRTWQTIARQMQHLQDRDRIPVVVCDALPGVARALDALATGAAAGRDTVIPLARIKERHAALAAELGVDGAVIDSDLADLEGQVRGVALLGEVTPRVRARIGAAGPLMASRIGAAWLDGAGVEARWLDARSVLITDGQGSDRTRWLSATVPHDPDPDRARALAKHRGWVTQGCLAADPSGDTAQIGSAGADLGAAVLAARIGAEALALWTDTPGMFTADPEAHPEARQLRALDYDEAQEIATTGADGIHPAALAPMRAHRIPVSIHGLHHPTAGCTTIGPSDPHLDAQVKALAVKRDLALVSLEAMGMWQQVGFLARAFAIFAHHGLSIDAVSTSETNVTVTLDATAQAMDPGVLDAVIDDLQPLCRPRLISGCASVSLVGRGIRSILPRLAPALESFDEHRVHLMTQASNDLNLTFVIDEEAAGQLSAKLLAILFAHRGIDRVLGPTWRELCRPPAGRGDAPRGTPWWRDRRDALLAAAASGTPAYVYDEVCLTQRARALVDLAAVDQVLYAVKANPHPEILRRAASVGMGFECVSPGEIARVRQAVGHGPTVLFTPNFAPRVEYRDALRSGIRVTLDNLHPLEHWPELFADQEVFVRIDPGRGRGHHAKVRTAGTRSKFGVALDQLDRLSALVEGVGCRVVGLHAHVGSGVLDPGAWQEIAVTLVSVAQRFGDVEVLDLGGGLGVPDRPGRPGLDLGALDAALATVKTAHPGYALWLEPGRFLVAEGGVLLTRVTQLKDKGDLRYVGVDAGMHTLMRPALYGAHHHVVNLSRLDDPPTERVTVVGPICESGDVLARDRRLARVSEGDVLLFATAGAYGATMATDYNLRGRPAEVFLTRLTSD